MCRPMMLVVGLCVLVISQNTAIGQVPTNENLKVLEPLVGRWEGQIELTEDLVGVGKKGDKVPVVLEFAWGANGQAVTTLVSVGVDGNLVPFTVGLASWCPVEKKIIGLDTYAPGGSAKCIYRRDGKNIVVDAEGVDEEGQKTSAKYVFDFKSEDEMVSHFREGIKGGKPTPDSDATFKRVDMTSTLEEFEEYCKLMEGRWVGNITLAADTPGVGAEGDKLTAHSAIQREDDGHVLCGKAYAGDGSISWQVIYDAGARKIRESNGTSGGATWVGTIWKGDGKWCYRSVGSHPDGTWTTGDLTLEVADEGRTHTWSGILTEKGKGAKKLHEVYHRVNK